MGLRAALLTSPALLGLLILGCEVEPFEPPPPPSPPPPETLDMGQPDTGPSGCAADQECPEDQVCSSGDCVPKPERCMDTAGCGRADQCVRPLISTSSIAGLCQRPPASCERDAECAADQRCTGAGLCGRRALYMERSSASSASSCIDLSDCGPGDTLRAARMDALAAACAEDQDCGPGGRCASGACASCEQHAQCGALLCISGRCAEPSFCRNDAQCLPGNTCAQGQCSRPALACVKDASDSAEAPTPISPAVYSGLSLCGDESDWFLIRLKAFSAAQISVVHDPREATIVPDVFDSDGLAVEDLGGLLLPGLSVVHIPRTTEDQALLLRISSPDRPGAYTLHFEERNADCAVDTLDLYGDETPERALRVPPDAVLHHRLCYDDEDHAKLALGAQDILHIRARYEGEQTNIDLQALSDQGEPLPPLPGGQDGRSPSLSQEGLDLAPAAAQEATIKITALRTPSVGQPYSLTATRAAGARQAACNTAQPLSPSGLTTLSGALGAQNLGVPGCAPFAPYDRPDRLFHIPAAATERLLFATATSTEGAQLSLGVLQGCGPDARPLACARAELRGRPATLRAIIAPNEEAYLMLSAETFTAPFSLLAELSSTDPARIVNNTCEGAAELMGKTIVQLDNATDNHRFTEMACGQPDNAASAPERIYSLTVAGPGRTALELAGLGASPPLSNLWASTSADCALDAQSCVGLAASEISSGISRLILPPAPQPYTIGVESELGGVFSLSAIPNIECANDSDCSGQRCIEYACAPVPSGSTCPGQSVALDDYGLLRLSSSTQGANSDHDLSCISSTMQPDLVFRLSLSRSWRRLSARIVEAEFDAAMAIRTTRCQDTEDTDAYCDDDSYEALRPELTIEQPTEPVYYVIVDAYSGSGRFTLEIEAEP